MTLAGCHNRPRPRADATYMAQKGWLELRDDSGRAGRVPVLVEVKASFGTTACQVGLTESQSCCAGCQHAKQVGGPP